MSEVTEGDLREFLRDLVAVCKKHNMAIYNQDEYGMAAGPYPPRRLMPAIIEIYDINRFGYLVDYAETRFQENHQL